MGTHLTHLLTRSALLQTALIAFFTVRARAGLIEDIYYRTSDGKIVIAFGILVLTLVVVLVLFYYFRVPYNKYVIPAVFYIITIAFTCNAFIPWRWGLAVLGAFTLALVLTRKRKEKFVGVKIK